MSTNDVPGSNPVNQDTLRMGCWAEKDPDDGSLIFVESTEGGRVVFSMFDLNQQPVLEYRTVLAAKDFESAFSYKSGDKGKKVVVGTPSDKGKKVVVGTPSDKDPAKVKTKKVTKEKWVWHDKSPFPWDKVLGATKGGFKPASVDGMEAAVARVAKDLSARSKTVSPRDVQHLASPGGDSEEYIGTLGDRIGRAIGAAVNAFMKE